MRRSYLLLITAISLCIQTSSAYAEEKNTNDTIKTEENDSELDQIIVSFESFGQEMGTQKLDNIDIDRLPSKNGTISDLLKSNPNVRFQNTADASETQGEIKPDNVSFHGERFYNNAWLIDGLSNNDNINPGSKNGLPTNDPDGKNPQDLPAGGTQSFWINTDIIDSVDVYDSNISARYGQFTGGVVDAKIKNANTDKVTGSISYRTTRDSFTKFHIYGETKEKQKKNEDKFNAANKIYYQPRFIKHKYALNVNVPINEKMAVIFSYSKLTSKIPFFHTYEDEWKNQRRSSETFLIKGTYEADSGDTFNMTLMHSPHTQKYFRNNGVRDGFKNTGGGNQVSFNWTHLMDAGTLNTSASYKDSGNEIEHEDTVWYGYCPSGEFIKRTRRGRVFYVCKGRPRFRNDGGFGKYSTDRTSLTLKQNFNSNTFELGSTKHNFSLGWKADFAKAGYDRKQNIELYSIPKPTLGIDCLSGDIHCVQDEQYSSMTVKLPKRKISVGNNHYSAYVEDNIKYKRLELTPGIRVDYDEYLGNIDIAPRLTASFDIFGNKKTRIFGGVNRYYADSLLRNALGDNLDYKEYYKRSAPNAPWVAGTVLKGRRYRADEKIKTPFSDEFNIGLTQRFGNTEWTTKWVHRESKEQFSSRYEYDKAKKEKWYYLENNGGGESDSFTLAGRLMKPFETKYATISWSLGGSYSKSKSNFDYTNNLTADYDDRIDEDEDKEKIIFEGKVIDKGDMPALTFNSPWRFFADVNFDFPQLYLNWSNRLSYTAGYNKFVKASCSFSSAPDICDDLGYSGENITTYEKTSFRNTFSLDWHIAYKPPVGKGNLEVSVDVLNVLDTKIASDGPGLRKVNYKSGRQFWLGAKYSW